MASLIRAELARTLIEEVSDPSLKDVVVTEVELSKDLKSCRVLVATQSDISPKQEKEMQKGFQRAMPFFRRKIADNLGLRYVPTLEFSRDMHRESVARLLTLFDSVAEEPKQEPKKEIS